MSEKLPEVKARVPIKDRNNPHSAINIAPQVMAKFISAIPDEFFSMTPTELAKEFRKGRLGYDKDTELEEKLRISFWREYDRATDLGVNMQAERVCSGVCPVGVLNRVMNNSYRAAYICTPPDDYITTMQELLTIGLDQLRDILLLPHVDDQGRPLPRMADVKMRIIDSITMRVKGSVAHRLETKNLNLNVEADTRRPPTEIGQLTDPDEIDRRLKELLDGQTSKEATTIDVTPKS